jgi:hypothetical protein
LLPCTEEAFFVALLADAGASPGSHRCLSSHWSLRVFGTLSGKIKVRFSFKSKLTINPINKKTLFILNKGRKGYSFRGTTFVYKFNKKPVHSMLDIGYEPATPTIVQSCCIKGDLPKRLPRKLSPIVFLSLKQLFCTLPYHLLTYMIIFLFYPIPYEKSTIN